MDQTITMYLNQLAVSSPFLSSAAVFFAQYFPYLVVLLFVVLVLTQGKHPLSISPLEKGERIRLVAEGFGAAVLAWLGSQALRLFIHRPRPFVADPGITALIEKTSYSFPSGHAAFFFALSTVIYIYNKRAGMWFFVASAVIGFARAAAGIHYPTDILGGGALGVVMGLAVCHFFRKYMTGFPLSRE